MFPAAGGWLVPALAQQLPHAVPVIAMLLVVWVLTETPRLLSLAGVFVRPMRTDPGVLWGCGVVAGGYASMWALAHPGYSEHYFWTVTIGLSTVMTVTNAARVLPAQRRARTLAPPLLAVAVLGVAAGYATTTFGRVNLDAPVRTVIEGRLRPFALVVPALVVAVLVTVLLRMLCRRWTLPLLTAATALLPGGRPPGHLFAAFSRPAPAHAAAAEGGGQLPVRRPGAGARRVVAAAPLGADRGRRDQHVLLADGQGHAALPDQLRVARRADRAADGRATGRTRRST